MLTGKPKTNTSHGNPVLTTKVICCSSVTSMDEPSNEEYKTLKGATSHVDENVFCGCGNTTVPTSTGEPTLHPEFCEFLETVSNTGVVPNYTTNGIILSDFYNKSDSGNRKLAEQIIEYTKFYVGGVAVSFGNKHIRDKARSAINALLDYGNTNVNIHHLISTKESVDEFVSEYLRYGDNIAYHVLLPLMPAGRSAKGIEEGVFEYLENIINENKMHKIAFGAHFINNLRTSNIKTWLYDEHSLSANCLLKPNNVVLTKSSFDLTPIKTIEL